MTETLVGRNNINADIAWIPAKETWVYSSADDPTYVISIANADLRSKYSKGMKVKFNQDLSSYLKAWFKCNETSGTTLVDNSGNNHDGTASRSAILNNVGYIDRGLFFVSSSSDRITFTDHSDWKPTGKFTIEFRFKRSNIPTADSMIFWSGSQNPNVSGIRVTAATSTGVVWFLSGRNTGTIENVDYKSISGIKNICDGVWHTIRCCWDGNLLSIYVDGILENSAYWPYAPGYASTNYVRLGCANLTGTDTNFLDGYIDDFALYNGVVLDGNTALQVAKETTDENLQYTLLSNYIQYGIITDVNYSSPNTLLTLYMGTDYDLLNSSIVNPYFSTQKAPYGFPLDPSKWEVKITDTIFREQSNPVAGTWYNLASLAITIPIGVWDVSYKCALQINSYTNPKSAAISLSTSNNSESDKEFTTEIAGDDPLIREAIYVKKFLNLSSKTTYYLIEKAIDSGIGYMSIYNQEVTLVIRAICAYL